MNEDELVFIDEKKSVPWNYVNRVEKELGTNNDYQYITINPLLPRSYKEVVIVLSRASNHSRVALLIDDDEEYVAFMLVVDDDCIPFLLEDLDEIKMPTKCIYKVYKNTELANSNPENGELQEFIQTTVIPELNNEISSWTVFPTFDND